MEPLLSSSGANSLNYHLHTVHYTIADSVLTMSLLNLQHKAYHRQQNLQLSMKQVI